jgi:hypothetical protein
MEIQLDFVVHIFCIFIFAMFNQQKTRGCFNHCLDAPIRWFVSYPIYIQGLKTID